MDSWRKIDIDQWDEDRVLEAELAPVDPRPAADVLSLSKSAAQQARSLVSSGDQAGALAALLADPPYGPDAEVGEAKNLTLASVLEVLNSTRSTDIPKTIAALDLDQHDLLMAYIYKGLAHPENGASAVLLQWHEKVRQLNVQPTVPASPLTALCPQLTEVAGAGAIVRTMTDRRAL